MRMRSHFGLFFETAYLSFPVLGGCVQAACADDARRCPHAGLPANARPARNRRHRCAVVRRPSRLDDSDPELHRHGPPAGRAV